MSNISNLRERMIVPQFGFLLYFEPDPQSFLDKTTTEVTVKFVCVRTTVQGRSLDCRPFKDIFFVEKT